jgi:type IV pilus biogenesis protein CpaD/CtpE
MKRFFLIVAVPLLVAGCADEAAQIDRATGVQLVTVRREVVVPVGLASNANWLLRQAGFMAEADLRAVRAKIVTERPREAEVLRSTLIKSGIDPTRITTLTSGTGTRRRAVIVFTRTIAETQDCRASVRFAFPDDPSHSLMSLAHCLRDNDLANTVVDPADLVASPRLENGDGAYLASGVRAWRQGGAGAPTSSSSNTSSSSSASSPSSMTDSSSSTTSH